MCRNKTCPSRDRCYRYRAVPTKSYQAYLPYEPDDTGKCDDFVRVFDSDKDLAPRDADG